MSAVRKIEDLTTDPELAGQYDYQEAIEREKFECHLTGLEEGMEKGIEKGMEKKSVEIAKSMLRKNIEIQFISECTGLSISEIEKIK